VFFSSQFTHPFSGQFTHPRKRFFNSIHPPAKILQTRYGIHDQKGLLLSILLQIGGSMARKEYSMIEIVDVLRRYQQGDGIRAIARSTGIDRNTVRKYLRMAQEKGFSKDGAIDLESLATDVFQQAQGPNGPPTVRDPVLSPYHQLLAEWLDQDQLTLTKAHIKLARMGTTVSYSSLYRYVQDHLAPSLHNTVRMAECAPGEVAEVDFGRLGLLEDPEAGRKRLLHALVVTLVYSRHQYVWITFRQDLSALINGIEEAWSFFGGVTRRLVIDNLRAAVMKSDRYAPVFQRTFLEYSQHRGFILDPAVVRHPEGKATVERQIPYVRENFFKGESFRDREHVQQEAIQWCQTTAGLRIHGTTRQRPRMVFEQEEQRALLPLVEERFDPPQWGQCKVHPDHHIRFAYALYSIPTPYLGRQVDVRKDSQLVRVYLKGELIKTHPVMAPGQRSTDFDDYPKEKTPYAMRSCTYQIEQARNQGEACHKFMKELLSGDFPWARLRQAQKLLRLAQRYGKKRVEEACQRALDFDLIDVTRVERMVLQALAQEQKSGPRQLVLPLSSRFQRPASYFTQKEKPHGNP
jgi:transposase